MVGASGPGADLAKVWKSELLLLPWGGCLGQRTHAWKQGEWWEKLGSPGHNRVQVGMKSEGRGGGYGVGRGPA